MTPHGVNSAYCEHDMIVAICRLCPPGDHALPDFGQQISTRSAPPPDPLRAPGTDAEAAAQDYLDRSDARRADRRIRIALALVFCAGVILGWLLGGVR